MSFQKFVNTCYGYLMHIIKVNVMYVGRSYYNAEGGQKSIFSFRKASTCEIVKILHNITESQNKIKAVYKKVFSMYGDVAQW